MDTTLTRWRITVDAYHRMAEAGILGEDDPVELIEGELIAMAAAGGDHINCVIDLTDALSALVHGRARVSVQNPLWLSEDSEPEPDIVLLRPRAPGDPRRATPRAAEALLVIEVADSSLVYDRRTKLRLYADAGIAEAWIVNLRERVVEVYRDPAPGAYHTTFTVGRGAAVHPLAFPEIALRVSDIFGE